MKKWLILAIGTVVAWVIFKRWYNGLSLDNKNNFDAVVIETIREIKGEVIKDKNYIHIYEALKNINSDSEKKEEFEEKLNEKLLKEEFPNYQEKYADPDNLKKIYKRD